MAVVIDVLLSSIFLGSVKYVAFAVGFSYISFTVHCCRLSTSTDFVSLNRRATQTAIVHPLDEKAFVLSPFLSFRSF